MSSPGSRDYELAEQLVEEFAERYARGERPSVKEYCDRHPHLADLLRDLIPAMVQIEQVKEGLEAAEEGPTPPPLTHLGDFHILREIGHGGMGVVYEAEQVSLGRRVALKVLTQATMRNPKQKRRFEREARAAAKLHHTNIVPVFGTGEHDGTPYYVMQFIQGLGLDQVIEELARMGAGDPGASPAAAAAPAGREVSAVVVARSLMTGDFQSPTDGADLAAAGGPGGTAGVTAGASAQALGLVGRSDGAGLRVADTSGASSGVTLPGQSESGGRKARRLTYWQSVARIGVQVAEALEYAHRQGVIHRDIKPSNLLLDLKGTVWVTDFGLAKAEGAENLTHTGDILGTLRYMPPEAFDGKADASGDLYSLGLTLYELAALRPAFEERERNRLIKQVTTAEPSALSAVRPGVPRDLETIIHKAIDKDPGRRYATAAAMAADLQRFVDDEPILARRARLVERVGRWCRHYPGVAALTAALALVLVGVTAASVLAAAHFDRLAREESRAADRERQARQEADQAKEHEAALRRQAEDAKQQAEANFARARQVVDRYFTTVSESQLLRVPGMQPLRRDLLQEALAFYKDFLKDRGDDPAVRGELAATYLRVGKIRRELGEVGRARDAWEQARGLYEELLKAEPESVQWRHGLAQCHYLLGHNDEAIALWEGLVRPDRPRFRKELAAAYNERGTVRDSGNRPEEALRAYQQSLALRETLVRLNPEDPEAQRDLGTTLNNIGVLLARKGRTEEALAMYRRAAEHGEAAFARAPQLLPNGRSLAVFQSNVAHAERGLGHPDAALAAYRRAAEVWRKLARDNPAVPRLHLGLFGAYRQLSLYQRQLKQAADAERTARLAREVLDRWPGDSPAGLYDLACCRALCSTFLGEGKEKLTAEDRAEQEREADRAVQALRQAVAAGFRDLEHLRKSPDLNGLRGRKDFQSLEADLAARVAAAPAEKLKASRQALALREKAAQADPKNRRLRADLAASQHAVALVLLDLGKRDEAQEHIERAVALRAALLKEEPENEEYLAGLVASRLALGHFYWRVGRLAEGLREKQRALAAVRAELEKGPPSPRRLRVLADAEHAVGDALAQAGLWAEADRHFTSSFTRWPGRNAQDWYSWAVLRLLAGDVGGYRKVCAQMEERFRTSDLPDIHVNVLRALSLGGGAGVDVLVRERDQAAKAATSGPWSRGYLAASYVRSGLSADALRELRGVSDWHFVPTRALALHGAGREEEARRALLQADEWLDGALLRAVQLSGPRLADVYWWQDFGWFLLQRREAWQALHGKAPPDDPRLLLCHARLDVLLGGRPGPTGKAAADFRKAVAALDGKALEAFLSRPFESEADRLLLRLSDEVVLQRLTAEVERTPGDVWKRWARGDWHARFRRWKEAAADYKAALEGAPVDAHRLLQAAPVLVAAGDRDGYRRLCRDVLRRFGETRDAPTADRAAKACLLLPETTEQTEEACRLADRAAALGQDHEWGHYFVFCKALADYRRGDCRAAAAALPPLLPRLASAPALTAECHLVLAMALHRQGEAKAAREHLEQGAALLKKYAGGPPHFFMTKAQYNPDWLIAWLLHREARALIAGEKAGTKR